MPKTDAFLDSFHGLIPCAVQEVTDTEVVVDFPPDAEPIHWSGQTSNAWRGLYGERFSHRHVVPADAVRVENGVPLIRPYSWRD